MCIYIYTSVCITPKFTAKKICVSVRRGKTTVTAAGRGGWWTPLRIFDSPSPLYWSCHFKNNGHMHLRTYIYIVQYVSRVYVVVRYVYTVCMYNYLYIYMKIHYLLFGGRKQNLGDDCLFLSTRLVVLVIPKYIYICTVYSIIWR